jgi:hypothetical protein
VVDFRRGSGGVRPGLLIASHLAQPPFQKMAHRFLARILESFEIRSASLLQTA